MRKTPPPMPPPEPGPTPAPVPTPTPPPEPEPIPAPDPVPFDGGAEGSAAADGTPKFGILFWATRTWGGTTTVGSAVNLGCGFRRTIWGGVICCIASFGNRPLGAGNGSWSPPPPPPLTTFLATGRA